MAQCRKGTGLGLRGEKEKRRSNEKIAKNSIGFEKLFDRMDPSAFYDATSIMGVGVWGQKQGGEEDT